MKGWEEIKIRWKRNMPKFFKRVFWLGSMMLGMTLAVNEAFALYNIEPHEWWNEATKYLIGISAGAMFISKFTVNDKSGLMDEEEKKSTNTVLDHDDF